MLPWHQRCIDILGKKGGTEALRFIVEGDYDLNDTDPLDGMTLLMHLVKDPAYNDFTRRIVRATDPTLDAPRKLLDIGALNKNGNDAYALAKAAGNQGILPDIDVESQRAQRIRNSQPETIRLGYHDTSFSSYGFIQADLKKKRFPMIGGTGGYFGGGIYFAATQQQSTLKALNHGRGFECRLKMGNVYKIHSLAELEEFYQRYFNSKVDRSWYKTPSDVIRMRLLTNRGESYDSVWGQYDDALPSLNDRILPTGDEYVVYSADQVEIKDSFDVFNNVWFSKTQSFPNHATIYSHFDNDAFNLSQCKPGDILITVYFNKSLGFTMDTLQFVYEDDKKKFYLLPPNGLTIDSVHIPIAITRLTSDATSYYRRLLPIVDTMELHPSDVSIRKLFQTSEIDPSSILDKYTIILHSKKNLINFVHKDTQFHQSFDPSEIVKSPLLVLQRLGYGYSSILIGCKILLNNTSYSKSLPLSLRRKIESSLPNGVSMTDDNHQWRILTPVSKDTRIQTILTDYLLRGKNKRPSPSNASPEKESARPSSVPIANGARPYASYFSVEVTDDGIPILDKPYQHGDILKNDHQVDKIWFYIAPTPGEKGRLHMQKDSYGIVTVPLAVTRHLKDVEGYYRPLLTQPNPNLFIMQYIKLTVSPYDVFWENDALFKGFQPEDQRILKDIRFNNASLIVYKFKNETSNFSRNEWLVQYHTDKTDFNFLNYHSIPLNKKLKTESIESTIRNIYWEPKPVVLSIDFYLYASDFRIHFTNVFHQEKIIRWIPPQTLFKMEIEESPNKPSVLTLRLPRRLYHSFLHKVKEYLSSSSELSLPFGTHLR